MNALRTRPIEFSIYHPPQEPRTGWISEKHGCEEDCTRTHTWTLEQERLFFAGCECQLWKLPTSITRFRRLQENASSPKRNPTRLNQRRVSPRKARKGWARICPDTGFCLYFQPEVVHVYGQLTGSLSYRLKLRTQTGKNLDTNRKS